MFYFSKYKISSRKEIKDLEVYMKYLRETGREKIMDRLRAIKNQEHVPTDILSSILHSWSTWLFFLVLICEY